MLLRWDAPRVRIRIPRPRHPEHALLWAGLVIWHMAVALLAGLAGQVSMLPRVEAQAAVVAEREETAGHLWRLYQDAHCQVRELELHVQVHLWADYRAWPDGDPSGIVCASDPAGSPLLANQAGQGAQPAAPQRASEAGRGGAAAVVADRAGP